MKTKLLLTTALGLATSLAPLEACEVTINSDPAFASSPSLKIKSVAVETHKDLDLVVFSMTLEGVTCYMQVNTSCMARPMLGVYQVYSVAYKDLSLPFKTR